MIIKRDQILALSQIVFGVNILICILLIPRYFLDLDQGGVSNYGTEPFTNLLFTIGFLSAALGALYATTYYRLSRSLKIGVTALSLSYLLVMLSTYAYKDNDSLESWHHLAALTLINTMIINLILLRKQLLRAFEMKLACFMFVVGLSLGIMTGKGIATQLLSSQLLCGISFGYILCRTVTLNKSVRREQIGS